MKSIYFSAVWSLLASVLLAQNPILIAPPDIVVSCGFQFGPSDLSDINSNLFGEVHLDSASRKKVYTNDIVCHKMCELIPKIGYPGPIPPMPMSPPASSRACDYYNTLFDTVHKDRLYQVVWGFDGYVKNPVEMEISISVIDNRSCRQGKILRVFSTPGLNNTEVKDTQIIWILDCDPFYINPLDPCDPKDDIIWPHCGEALTVYQCGPTPPDSLGPKILKDSCLDLEFTFSDFIRTDNPDYCFTIYRQWMVTDWCQFEPTIDPAFGRWSYEEIIYVIDTLSPENLITGFECQEADSTGFYNISLTISAKDDCTPDHWIYYTYVIDLYNDGSGQYDGYDIKVGPLNTRQINNHDIPAFKDNPYATNDKDPRDASGRYPAGKHKIVFTTEDGCRNKARDSFYFEILPQVPPEFECPDHPFVFRIQSPQTRVFRMKDILIKYEDNCTPYGDLKIFINGDRSLQIDIINCFDFYEAGYPDTLKRMYELWIQNLAGELKICPIEVDYINTGNCDSINKTVFSGQFITHDSKAIEELNLEIVTQLGGTLLFPTNCENS